MKGKFSTQYRAYMPQKYKTFEGALEGFLAEECPQLGGCQTRQILVKCISDIVRQFYPETSHMRQGQMLWSTVHKDEFTAYGKSIKKTRLQSVILDVVTPQDAELRATGKTIDAIKKESVARLCQQAFKQKGCLTIAELSLILQTNAYAIGNYIKEWEEENNSPLPRRGTIHDMGPSLTHKRIIIRKLFLEQKPAEQVCRETNHSPDAVQRYISAFKQILLCKQKGMNTEEIAFAVRMTVGLVKEYEEIIEEFKDENHVLDRILRCKDGEVSKC